MKTQYIKSPAVKKLAKALNRRVGTDFLVALDAHIESRIYAACKVHNGGKKTLDAGVAGYVGVKP